MRRRWERRRRSAVEDAAAEMAARRREVGTGRGMARRAIVRWAFLGWVMEVGGGAVGGGR